MLLEAGAKPDVVDGESGCELHPRILKGFHTAEPAVVALLVDHDGSAVKITSPGDFMPCLPRACPSPIQGPACIEPCIWEAWKPHRSCFSQALPWTFWIIRRDHASAQAHACDGTCACMVALFLPDPPLIAPRMISTLTWHTRVGLDAGWTFLTHRDALPWTLCRKS